MLLKNKNAIIYGGGGAIGGSIAKAFAEEGANVFLAGPTRTKLQTVANDIIAKGGKAEVAIVDALNEDEVNEHADVVAAKAGSIDIAVNATGFYHVQGKLLPNLSLAEYENPISKYMRTHFITAKAVAKHMVKQNKGVLIMLSTPGSVLGMAGIAGFGVACAGIEALTRLLAADLGPDGVRVLCIRPDAIPEAVTLKSHSNKVFNDQASIAGKSVLDMLDEKAQNENLLKRLPTLKEVADVAAFVASDKAGAMTGSVVNLTCGSIVFG